MLHEICIKRCLSATATVTAADGWRRTNGELMINMASALKRLTDVTLKFLIFYFWIHENVHKTVGIRAPFICDQICGICLYEYYHISCLVKGLHVQPELNKTKNQQEKTFEKVARSPSLVAQWACLSNLLHICLVLVILSVVFAIYFGCILKLQNFLTLLWCVQVDENLVQCAFC